MVIRIAIKLGFTLLCNAAPCVLAVHAPDAIGSTTDIQGTRRAVYTRGRYTRGTREGDDAPAGFVSRASAPLPPNIDDHIVATGSSALHFAAGSRESLAGRFERLTLPHWSAQAVAQTFAVSGEEAADLVVRMGSYPGALPMREDVPRWSAYVRDAILDPAIGRDILALASVRRPALLRQVFGVAASSPAQIVSLQKLQGQLQDVGALETVAHYLALLEEAFLVAPVPKYSTRAARRRASPPKLVTRNYALVAVMDPQGIASLAEDPARFGTWVENACLAHAWNSGQGVSYWREEPLEVDGILEGSWGKWAIEVRTGKFQMNDLTGLLEFTRRHPAFKPLVICNAIGRATVERAEIPAITWQEFLLAGPPGTAKSGT